jgi:hypothetical protein
MGKILEVVAWAQLHWVDIVAVYTGIVTVASIVVKLTPSLKDDDKLKGVIKFIGKYIALNR